MEAKDTVMSNSSKRQFIYIKDKPDNNLRGFMEDDALLFQAEISFKAGYDKRESEFVYNPDYLNFDKGVKAGKMLGKLAGRREVVEWINANRIGGYNICIKVGFDEWQAKLKEWGIRDENTEC